MRLVYFAKVREAVGRDSEERAPAGDLSIAQLLDQLCSEGENYAAAFAERAKLRFALDQQMVPASVTLGEARELAIFPPVTGG